MHVWITSWLTKNTLLKLSNYSKNFMKYGFIFTTLWHFCRGICENSLFITLQHVHPHFELNGCWLHNSSSVHDASKAIAAKSSLNCDFFCVVRHNVISSICDKKFPNSLQLTPDITSLTPDMSPTPDITSPTPDITSPAPDITSSIVQTIFILCIWSSFYQKLPVTLSRTYVSFFVFSCTFHYCTFRN